MTGPTTRALVLLALVWATFLSVFGFAALGDSSYPHVAFHVVALALLVPALRLAVILRREGPTRPRRVLATVLVVTVALAVVGHVLELLTALVRLADDGWANRDTSDVWEGGPHVWAANLTVPAMMLSMLAALALAILYAARRDPTRSSAARAADRPARVAPSVEADGP